MKSETQKRRAGRAADKPARSIGQSLGFNLTNVLCLLLGMGAMALIGVFPPLAPRPRSGLPAQAATAVPRGPWGELEYTRFTLEEPADYLPDSRRRLDRATWFFEHQSADDVRALLSAADIAPALQAQLLETNRWQVEPMGVRVSPSTEVLVQLGREARQRLYALLRRSDFNPLHQHPFRFRSGAFDEWFADRGLPAVKLALVRSLTFTNRGGALCLVDIDVLQQALTTNQFRAVFESLYAEPSVLVKLRVDAKSDIDALLRYWGQDGRGRSLRPLLKSLARLPGGGSINIVALLPPFARLRLYTFDSTNEVAGAERDCFWTAMNFYNDPPDARLFDSAYALSRLSQDYAPAASPRQLGDLLVLVDDSGRTVHACVFIAADFVFTKNGADYLQPWVLMTIPDMLARYATDQPAQLHTLRRKGPAKSPN